MFGYVTPCKMELKLKDYEKFKAYYCGLCREIKNNFGNLPRLTLNYDMTFLAVLLDSLCDKASTIRKEFCAFHPMQKRLIISQNSSLEYAAFCNVILAYYKLLDNVSDDNSIKSRIYSSVLGTYLKKASATYLNNSVYIKRVLGELYDLESNSSDKSLDELSHNFADLTGFILSSYPGITGNEKSLYWLGYNLGKWIYIIDAYDDLEKDMLKGKFNAINAVFNKNRLPYNELISNIDKRIEFTLINCAQCCLEYLDKLPIKKNYDLLHNILQFGLMEKMDKVFNKGLGGDINEKSL